MHVAQLWRYPVKSCRGERLDAAEVRGDGIPGDRAMYVADGSGDAVTARTRPGLLGIHAGLDGHGEILVNGRRWHHPAAAEAVRRSAGDEHAELVRARGGHRFDDTPLLVATDGAIAALGEDGRRLRPNIVIGGVEGTAERDWEGRRLRFAGGLEILAAHLCQRCVITTVDPDSLEVDPGVLRRINDDWEGRIALNCNVVAPGRVAVGEAVEVV